jgi:hypothetical protein
VATHPGQNVHWLEANRAQPENLAQTVQRAHIFTRVTVPVLT